MNHEPSRRASTIIPRLGAKIADRTYEGDQQSDARATETPFCGWVVPNHLDESLMIYDGGGQALGVIPSRDVTYRPAHLYKYRITGSGWLKLCTRAIQPTPN